MPHPVSSVFPAYLICSKNILENHFAEVKMQKIRKRDSKLGFAIIIKLDTLYLVEKQKCFSFLSSSRKMIANLFAMSFDKVHFAERKKKTSKTSQKSQQQINSTVLYIISRIKDDLSSSLASDYLAYVVCSENTIENQKSLKFYALY